MNSSKLIVALTAASLLIVGGCEKKEDATKKMTDAASGVTDSLKKAADMLGYRTTVDVMEGYRRAVDWCRAEGQLS